MVPDRRFIGRLGAASGTLMSSCRAAQRPLGRALARIDLGGVAARIQTEAADPALVGLAQADDRLDDGGLAGPVGPDEREDLPSSTVNETPSTTARTP